MTQPTLSEARKMQYEILDQLRNLQREQAAEGSDRPAVQSDIDTLTRKVRELDAVIEELLNNRRENGRL
jgi:hypothetical protein